ncbi:Trm112 family protein [bacterium]|nr:Trm112 family protein [bacterium]NBW56493.1 Trm112 family protein [bacterium]
MKYWKGHFFNALVCPYCCGTLIKYRQFLVCRFHKLGFPIVETTVDFRTEKAYRFDIDEIKKIP